MPVQLQVNLATDAPPTAAPVLEVRGLRVAIDGAQGRVLPVDGVDLAIAPGRTMCLVGESGCGKSLTCFAIAGLLPPGGRVAAGSIRLAGQELTGLPSHRMAALRGREVARLEELRDNKDLPLVYFDVAIQVGFGGFD